MSGDVVVFWILALTSVALFFFIYGIVEETIQKRRAIRKSPEPQHVLSSSPSSQPLNQTEIPPENCGYDSPELFREDALMHIRENEREFAEHERNIQAILAEMKRRGHSD